MAINPLQAPINYMGMIPQVNLGQEFAEFGQALAQRQERIKKQEFQQQYSQDLQSALATPTQKTWSDMIAKYPQQREAFAEARKGYGEERLTNEFNQGFGVSAALENKNPEVAKAGLQTIIEAKKNSGEPTQIYQQAFDALEAGNVTGAQAIVNMALSTADPDRFQKTVEAQTKAKQAPSMVSESVAKAEEAKIKAEFARPNALQELEKRGWEVKKIASDINIDKQNARIAAMNAATAKEGNALKRQELQIKVNEAIDKRNETIRTKATDLESATSSIDNMINTADRILQTPKNVIGSAAGPVSSRMPTLTQDTADFEALVETLGSQAFMAQIPNLKGMGALSNAEGEKLQAALQNFSLKQSPEQLLKNVKEAQRIIMKGRKVLSDRYGVPQTIPDTPDVKSTGSDIDALLKKYGG